MAKYQNIKNQKVATVVGQNEKTKVFTLEYEDGKTTDITSSTLKRWWKLIEDDEIAGDGTPLAEVGKEIAAQAKAKASAAKKGKVAEQDQPEDEVVDTKKELAKKAMKEAVEKQKKEAAEKAKQDQKPAKTAGKKKAAAPKEMQPHVKEGLQFIFDWAKKQKDEVFAPANGMNMRTLKTGGHMYCKIDFANKGFRIAFKSAALQKNAKAPDRTLNHMFDYVYIFDKDLTAKDKDFLTKALTATREYRIARNNAAAGKGKKEDK